MDDLGSYPEFEGPIEVEEGPQRGFQCNLSEGKGFSKLAGAQHILELLMSLAMMCAAFATRHFCMDAPAEPVPGAIMHEDGQRPGLTSCRRFFQALYPGRYPTS
ncbi:hypothetical protein VTO73DRAFT_12565 [Trametes versicolor]